jgi:hypothetical protein
MATGRYTTLLWVVIETSLKNVQVSDYLSLTRLMERRPKKVFMA